MCGIFFCASTDSITPPTCIGAFPASDSSLFEELVVELGSVEISHIIDEDLYKDTRITPLHVQKIQNVGKLRELQEALNKFKNKKDVSQLEQVQIHIENLKLEDLEHSQRDPRTLVDTIISKVVARGPDYVQYRQFTDANVNFQLLSSILSLRQPFTKQPEIGEDFVLQFNGELYNDECLDSNDVDFLMGQLNLAFLASSSRADAVLGVFGRLNGEFAFVLSDLKEKKVYFGKDFVGKRSLLYQLRNDSIIISSVFPDRASTDLTECDSSSIHVFDLQTFSLQAILYESVWSSNPSPQQIIFKPIAPSTDTLELRVEQLHDKLRNACELRQKTIHPLKSSEVELGILFSGGLDCTVIAGLIAENYVKEGKPAVIDLLTVGFENPRTGADPRDSPDRQLSERSFLELSRVFSGSCVKFRLVQVDVSYGEWLSNKSRVLELIHPCSTEMDLSIAIAFYFACKARDCEALECGKTFDREECTKIPNYTSAGKVLFSGLGADELFGGYSRHENIFNDIQEDTASFRDNFNELSESLIHDIKIIYERNLGRDDRVISCWGKELRYPYLDNSVINFSVNEVEPDHKVRFTWGTQKTKKGEKRIKIYSRKHILRQLAHKMGLSMAAEEMKRAIQFGARSAKLEIGQSKTKGTERLD